MSNLRDKLTDEEWNELESSLIGRNRFPVSDEQVEKTDPIVSKVITKFSTRSKLGITKYGTTLEDNNATLFEWLNHLQEELMDATLYIEKLKNIVK
jgi:hypothetical protein